MKWFFLPFIPLLALVGNLVIFAADLSPLRLAVALAFNIFIACLVIAWWHAYFTVGDRRARGLAIGHSLLLLSLGIAVSSVGVYALATGDCSVIGSPSNPGRLSSQLAAYAQAHGFCRPLGGLVGALGLALAFPAVRLLAAMRSHA